MTSTITNNGCKVEAYEDNFYYPDEFPNGVDYPVFEVQIIDNETEELIDFSTGFLSIEEALQSGVEVSQGF